MWSIEPSVLVDVLHGGGGPGDGELVASGLGASPGVARGRAYGDVESALEAWDRGEEIVYVAAETSPIDEPAMRVAAGIVTYGGGLASHAAVISRDLGIPAVCGTGAVSIEDGTELVVDGGSGEVRLGGGRRPRRVRSAGADSTSSPRRWRRCSNGPTGSPSGRLEVWANADSPETVVRALVDSAHVASGSAGWSTCSSGSGPSWSGRSMHGDESVGRRARRGGAERHG